MPSFTPPGTQQWIPWLEAVGVSSVAAGGVEHTATVQAGVYRLGANEAAPSNGVYTRHDIKVTLATTAVAWVPKPRDFVTFGGDNYTVLSVDRSDWTRHYVLTARNLVLAEGLRELCSLLRPSNAKDAAGRPGLTAYTTVAAAVPCRVQPDGWQAGDAMERRTGPRTFTAYLGQQVDARAKDVLAIGDARYTVTAAQNPERITDLMSLSLEEVL